MAFDLPQNLVLTLYRPEHYIIYADFNVSSSFQKKYSINGRVCLREESCAYKAQGKMDCYCILKGVCMRKKSHIKSKHFV